MVFTFQSEDAGIWLEERFIGNTDFVFPDSLVLDSNQLNYFTQKFINRQLREKFGRNNISEMESVDTTDYIFYSKPHQVLKLEDYIQLDSIHEYFYELIPTVHIKPRNNNYQVYLTNPKTNYRVGEKPALFIDGVYYPFPDDLMKVQPKEVERVEVIPNVYYYRKMTFDGIISVFTRDRDFMDVPLQPNMFRMFYEIAEPSPNYFPKKNAEIKTDSNLPDLRWVLLWQPQTEITSGNSEIMEFFTSDVTGEFEISVLGITSGGEIIKGQQAFTVE